MRRHLRNTRRGWMIFNEPDKGGAAGGAANPDPTPAPGEKKDPASPVSDPANPNPASNPDPANPPGTTAATAPAKPSVFARAAAMLKDKSELLTEISARDTIIVQRDGTIATITAENVRLKAENTELLAGKAQIEAALAASEKKATTASTAAVDIVAGLGFEAAKLPGAQPEGQDGEAPATIAEFQKRHGEMTQRDATAAGKFYDKYAKKFGL